jgi:hypothetical protein
VTYKVKLVSQTNAIVLIITGLVIILVSSGTLLPKNGLQNTGLSILIVSFLAIIAIFLWQKFVTGWTEWQVDKDRIAISWTKKFAFSKVNDYVFEWKDVEKIWQGMDPGYYNLKFKFTTGQKITFFHATFGNDDFNDLLEILYQTLDERKKLRPTGSFASAGGDK